MYGYSMNLDANSLRDSITLMTEEKTLTVQIDEKIKTKGKLGFSIVTVFSATTFFSDISLLKKATEPQNTSSRLLS